MITLCPSSTVSLLTLYRSQFVTNLDETCSECLPQWNLGHVQNWVTWGQKQGHQVKSKENIVNTLEVPFFKQSSWILLKMLVLMISRSSSKLGHMGSKTRSPCQIKGKPCKHSWSHFWSNHHESCSKYLSWWVLSQVWNWVTWGQKLGHWAKSAENLVNALAVTFLKQLSWIWHEMFVLMISRSSLKLGHLNSKTRSPGQISREPS